MSRIFSFRPGESPLLISVPHDGWQIPTEIVQYMCGAGRGIPDTDWHVAQLYDFASQRGASMLVAHYSRYVVDLNRPPHNPAVFSAVTRGLPRLERDRLLAHHHAPHWQRVRARLAERTGRVVHLAIHSFTPVLHGERRDFEIGLLYDPSRLSERALARELAARLRHLQPDLRVRRNAPYRGVADGLATALRRELPNARYVGLEIELNQRALARPGAASAFAALLARALTTS